ncbi:multinuclear nonheme iron-dependent oxidase [Aliivibrio fischeri]|uniref:multinuclear nonheme iron-dependent oxidase n=1 Tax=Aliivibrio fischeri TaxID=668 RepID=UPI00080E1BB2|nr:DUF692 family multinuclear iron-containing protein [Aliivibrio fischeri]OCH38012.1 hypothetical protein A6D99_12980 [Aliivibrio fischeri]OED51683.1 hypothetical protein BEI46_05650 [Aliivibrio fischeri]
MGKILIGVRWDDPCQNEIYSKLKEENLIDFVEVNYPVSELANPELIGLPIITHSSDNPIASSFGLNMDMVDIISKKIAKTRTPWTGEHVAFSGITNSGSLGYIMNPLNTIEDFNTCLENIEIMKQRYSCPLALELGPCYFESTLSDFENELSFLSSLASKSDSYIILDLTHLAISNNNLKRNLLFGEEYLDLDRVIEIHIAGLREGSDGFWHDVHSEPIHNSVLNLLSEYLPKCFNVAAITLEPSIVNSIDEIRKSLYSIKDIVNNENKTRSNGQIVF